MAQKYCVGHRVHINWFIVITISWLGLLGYAVVFHQTPPTTIIFCPK